MVLLLGGMKIIENLRITHGKGQPIYKKEFGILREGVDRH